MASTQKDITQALTEALRQAFGENLDARRFIDVTRVPLICQSIISIHEDIKEIRESLERSYVRQEEFKPVKAALYSAMGVIALAFLSGLLSLVFIK